LNGAGADIRNGWSKLEFNYAGDPSTDPSTQVAGLLATSYNGGAWTGGKFQHSTADAEGTTLGWRNNPTATPIQIFGSDGITLKNTIPAYTLQIMATIAGDVDLNGTIDFSDLNYILGDYGMTGATWADGDVNYDGVVDFSDLNYVLGNYGSTLPAAVDVAGSHIDAAGLAVLHAHGLTVVPEPGTIALLAAGLLGLLAYAWRKRS
jgi:hypothetical protein